MKRALHGLRGAAAIAFGVAVLLQVTPLILWANQWLTDGWEAAVPGDVLIVLGAEQQTDGLVGISSYWRTIYAVRAWREGKCARMVFSGGPSGGSPSSVAFEMARLAEGLGVPAEIITLEEKSQSTRENALFVTALVRDWPGRKALLTSDYHMRRARQAFERAGLKVRPVPAPDVGKRWNSFPQRWDCAIAVCQEAGKFLYYSVRRWI